MRVLSALSEFLWGIPCVCLLVFSGVFLFLKIKKTSFKNLKLAGQGEISPLSALCTALGASVGVGNIAGVASALCIGGAGAVFWMLLAALFGMVISFCENSLGFAHRKKENGALKGGPMYYIRAAFKGETGRILAVCFSLFCVLASFGIGNMSQTKAVAENLEAVLKIPALQETKVLGTNLYLLILGILLAVIIGAVLLGGGRRIISASEAVVPIAIAGYVIGCGYILILNGARLPAVFLSIFKNAFKIKSAVGGTGGFLIGKTISVGFKRGIFSNEAGMGSAVMVNSVSSVATAEAAGLVGALEVFIDTAVLCTLTALTLLSSPLANLESGRIQTANEMALVSEVFSEHLGDLGAVFIALSVLLFSVASIIGWAYYGQTAFTYLFGEKSRKIYSVIFTAVTLLGINISAGAVWHLSDIFNALMLFPNLFAVLRLYAKKDGTSP